MSSPMALSLQHLRDLGYDPWVVERDIPARPRPIKRDLLNLADIEAFAPDHTLYVQATSVAELEDHVAKAIYADVPRLKGDSTPPRSALRVLIASETRVFEIWAWSQRAPRKPWTVKRLRAVTVGVDRCGFVPVVSRETVMGPVQTSALGDR